MIMLDLQKAGWGRWMDRRMCTVLVLMSASLLIYNSCWPSKGFFTAIEDL